MLGFRYPLLILLLWAFFPMGCVETLITVRVFPDGRYAMEIFSQGDSLDIFNQDFPHPSDDNWASNVDWRLQDDEMIWSMKSLAVLEGDNTFNISDLPGPVKHRIMVEKENHYLSTTYRLKQVFTGRRAFNKYPAFASSLGGTGDSTKWISEVLLYITSQAMSDLQGGNYYRLKPILFERIQHSLQGIFSRVEEKTLFENLNRREIFIRTSFRPFAPNLPNGYIDTLISAMKKYEDERQITADLKDDAWIYQVLMPGIVTSTNADSIFGDTLKWQFRLDEFINDDLIISAESIEFSVKRVQILIISGFSIIIIFLTFWLKKKKSR